MFLIEWKDLNLLFFVVGLRKNKVFLFIKVANRSLLIFRTPYYSMKVSLNHLKKGRGFNKQFPFFCMMLITFVGDIIFPFYIFLWK